MKKLLLFIVVFVLVGEFVVTEYEIPLPGLSLWTQNPDGTLRKAYKDRRSGFQVRGKGVIIKLLSDDLKGSKHQRFVLKLSSGQTVLISHNIDLAPRINRLNIGDTVEFYGEYEWNSKGGVVHWTHHDPMGNHVGGWMKHEGEIYQ